MTSKKVLSSWLLAVAIAVVSACGGGGDKPATPDGASGNGPILLGLAGPITGSSAEMGDMMVKAATLAVEEINAAGGVRGRELALVIEDDQSKNDQAKIVSKKLAGNDDVVLVVGHFNSTCSLASKETYKRAGVVQFSPGSTNVNVCKGSEWTFRNLYHDEFQGRFLARYAQSALGAKRVAIFYDNDDYGIGLKDAFTAEAGVLGLEIVGAESYVREKTLDYSSALDNFAAKSPDIIFVSGLYNEAGAIARQARAKGLGMQFLGGDGVMSPGYLSVAGEAAEGTIVSCPFIFDERLGTDRSRAFRGAFQTRWSKDPDTWAALTYDAVTMAADTIAKVGPDRKAIRDHFASIDTREEAFEGVTGPTFFDENGDCLKPVYVAKVVNGQFVAAELQLFDDATAAPAGGEAAPAEGGAAPADGEAAPAADPAAEGGNGA